MDDIVALCKRRGFIFPASEIYQGINGFWDYGPLGVELKNNLRDAWWNAMVRTPPLAPAGLGTMEPGEPLSIVGVDTSIIQNPRVWEASGHVGGFNDPMVDCRETKQRYRYDHLWVVTFRERNDCPLFAYMQGEPAAADKKLTKFARKHEIIGHDGVLTYGLATADSDKHAASVLRCPLTDLKTNDFSRVVGPDTDKAGTLTEPRQFNLMFKTYVGAVQTEESAAYLRPETAQGIFLNFKNVVDTTRVKVPFGIAQIGKAFRNEVTPRNYIFRSREFEQMEMEWFCHPTEAS
ncbi:MAG TPA: glycine--tRNA ligase, partial [Polyangiales bacterium]